jgi:D-sedoheptulose 7-phosphate isomerase
MDCNKLSLNLDQETLIKMLDTIITSAKSNGNEVIVVNGGSATIASHVAVDFLKTVGSGAITFNESSLITCNSNDYGYEN